jgi:hypothetical protein
MNENNDNFFKRMFSSLIALHTIINKVSSL